MPALESNIKKEKDPSICLHTAHMVSSIGLADTTVQYILKQHPFIHCSFQAEADASYVRKISKNATRRGTGGGGVEPESSK